VFGLKKLHHTIAYFLTYRFVNRFLLRNIGIGCMWGYVEIEYRWVFRLLWNKKYCSKEIVFFTLIGWTFGS